VADAALTLYQTEWCPFSSAVREVLTELGLDFVVRQVEPWPKDRTELKAIADTDQIPVLRIEDGRFFRGTREIFAHLRERDPTARRGAPPSVRRSPRRSRVRCAGTVARVFPRERRARGS
jgi:glutathione S-transferase